MQLRKWLIPPSLRFFHMRSLEIAQMSPIGHGSRKIGDLSEITGTPQRVINGLPFAAGGSE